MGGLARPQRRARRWTVALGLLLAIHLAIGLVSCASSPQPQGFYYAVQPGDNLYRIGKRFGVPVETLIRVNEIRDVHGVPVGTRLYISAEKPRSTASSQGGADSAAQEARPRPKKQEVRKASRLTFVWPVRGRLTSRFGRRDGRFHEGIDMAAKRGTPIRAAESGKVIHSGRLGAYGKVVIVKHQGDYRSVYAHASKTHVRKGEFVDRGDKIAEVGSTGRATGSHLHFEIRRKETPRDPMLYLP